MEEQPNRPWLYILKNKVHEAFICHIIVRFSGIRGSRQNRGGGRQTGMVVD